jgi:hypothetical protein
MGGDIGQGALASGGEASSDIKLDTIEGTLSYIDVGVSLAFGTRADRDAMAPSIFWSTLGRTSLYNIAYIRTVAQGSDAYTQDSVSFVCREYNFFKSFLGNGLNVDVLQVFWIAMAKRFY